jgi:hypothetical protein
MRDQRLVGRRHRVAAQSVRPHPGDSLALQRRCGTLPTPADVERHQQMEIGIGVAGERQRRKARRIYDNSQFLPQLTDQGVLRPLVPLDLAAGKFPQPGHRLADRTLRDQHADIRIDQGASRDEDEIHADDPTDRAWKPGSRTVQSPLLVNGRLC